MEGVALTSLWVAAVRAEETDRPDGLFRDPFARRLAGDEGFRVVRSVEAMAAPVRPPSLQIRTRFLDDEILGAVGTGIRQVVILAAGMDARCYRLDWPAKTTVYEVDQPHVLEYKANKLEGESPRCERRTIGIDLRHDWPAALAGAGFDAHRPTLWLAEGLLHYLQERDALGLLTRVSELASPESVLLFDIIGRSAFGSPWVKYMFEFVEKLGAPWVFGTDEPEALLEPLGWDVEASELASVGHRFGRWPFPVAPRGTPGVPQNFFVKARRRGDS
jgi:methyltransferase (TIGR00027 family)